ncbi:DUF2065 domain-containing protein [Thalassotalea litorea]|uniref:DUF2065 domain-containing protein n=1 Tax=Thalassotalea litorea TaxID=2020715 RepID=A0A5R9IN14_9GAMM|nr:DUF2065 domain-containing protein [Thalassotalea litorea]TLU65843.1 DUF2065 domain-containing protein [Thalassotalea litorea]
MTLSIFLLALALMLIFEGIGPLLYPNRWQSLMLKLAQEDVKVIRQIGLVLIIAGLSLFLLFS